ncbi:transglutaminase-like domain-containing protein [Kribbella sp. DT2]|uniref:transglutaminase-like domain-containing protein n=1 Tax=Kribbella sp. DT2 TaxID=3393427 RepID=UPI003CF6291C
MTTHRRTSLTHSARDRLARHSRFSDPGRHGPLLRDLSGIEEICTAVSNLVLHYRIEEYLLRDDRRNEINARWVSSILDLDQSRHPGPLLDPRPPGERVAGCCRDHSLLAVAALREQGVPARTRLSFTDYFAPDARGDHVVAEWWNGTRWQRFDPELDPGSRPFDVRDLPTGEGSPFETAAEAWTAYRAGRSDPTRYGVAPNSHLSGPTFIRGYVIMDFLHRRPGPPPARRRRRRPHSRSPTGPALPHRPAPPPTLHSHPALPVRRPPDHGRPHA